MATREGRVEAVLLRGMNQDQIYWYFVTVSGVIVYVLIFALPHWTR